MNHIEFDDARARTYRKRLDVLAFRADAPFAFQKAWGTQEIRQGGWVVVPLADTGEALPDLYGIDGRAFEETYEPSPSLRPNHFRKKETVRAYQPGDGFTVDTVLADGHVEVAGATTGSFSAWVVRAPGGEVYPVEDEVFRRDYIEVPDRAGAYRVRNRDEHWAADGLPKRILALDGGGVRGILTLGYLERIEALLRERHGGADGFRLSHYFDLIAGTSTGAIIAACLAKGMRVGDVRQRYQALAASVFKRSWFRRGILRARYSSRRLREHLGEVFPQNTLGSTSLQTGLLVVAKRLDTGSTWLMNNNPRHPFFTAGAEDEYIANEDYPLASVVRASTAAPSYFEPEFIQLLPRRGRQAEVQGEFVDGGLSPHNNPALLALQLAVIGSYGARWPLDPDKLLLVSVGTGAAQPGTSRSWFAAPHAIKSLRSLMDDCAESVEATLQWLSRSPTARVIDEGMQDLRDDLLADRPLLEYLRYNVHFNRRWMREHLGRDYPDRRLKELQAMDRPEHLAELHALGVEAARRQVDSGHFPERFDLGA